MKLRSSSSSSSSSSVSRSAAPAGFTLIELVGAMAILTILAAAVTTPTIRQLSRMFREREERALSKIGAAVIDHAYHAHAVPSHTNFVASIAPRLGWAPNEVLNSAFGTRLVLIDDSFRAGPGSGARPPFVQNDQASIRPTNPRMMIVSSVGASLPAGLASGFLSSSTFSNIWHTAPGSIPAGWTWGGNPDDLLIQRVNLADQFVEVALNVTGNQFGLYTLDRGATNVLAGTPASLFVLRGTRLGLIAGDGRLQSTEVVNEPMTIAFATGVWRTDLAGAMPTWLADRDLDGCDLQALVDSFAALPENPRTHVRPSEVVDCFADTMHKYCDYARSGFDCNKRTEFSDARCRMETKMDHCMR